MRDYRVDAAAALTLERGDTFVFSKHHAADAVVETVRFTEHRQSLDYEVHDDALALADIGAEARRRTDEERAQDQIENRHFKAQHNGMTIAEELHLRDAFWDWSFV